MRQRYVEVRQRILGQHGVAAEQAQGRIKTIPGFATLSADAAHRVLRPILDARVDTTPDAVSPTLVVLRETFASRIGPAEEQARDRLDEERNKTAAAKGGQGRVAPARARDRQPRATARRLQRAGRTHRPAPGSGRQSAHRLVTMTEATRRQLTPEAKQALPRPFGRCVSVCFATLGDEAERRYRLSVSIAQSGLAEAPRLRRQRLEAWLDERVRSSGAKNDKEKQAARERFLAQAIKEAAATLLNRLVLLRHLEAMGLSRPAIVTGGWNSKGYRELRDFAPGLMGDETEGYASLLQLMFDDLAMDLPGSVRRRGAHAAVSRSPATLARDVSRRSTTPTLVSAWTDDTTLGWVYQYWNDPEREALDAKINARRQD